MSLSREEVDKVVSKFGSGVAPQVTKLLRDNAEPGDPLILEGPMAFTFLKGVLFGMLVALGCDEETANARSSEFYDAAVAEFMLTARSAFPPECPPQLN